MSFYFPLVIVYNFLPGRILTTAYRKQHGILGRIWVLIQIQCVNTVTLSNLFLYISYIILVTIQVHKMDMMPPFMVVREILSETIYESSWPNKIGTQ